MKKVPFTLFTAVLAPVWLSCGDCKREAEAYRLKECAIRVEQTKTNGGFFSIEGTNIYTKRHSGYNHQGGWYIFLKQHVELGDTVIKRKGELIFHIHKKDTTLAFPYECQGKIYQ